MPSAGEVASHLLAHLQSQLPPTGFHLEGIEIRVGALVEIDRDTLRAALCAALPGVEVRLTEVPPLLRCQECGVEYPHDEHPCPACGSARAEVVAGSELEIGKAWGTKVGG